MEEFNNKKNNREKIAAIIPAYNEERNIGSVLKVIMDSKCFDEIIVVDDASIDKTAEVCRAAGARVLRLAKNGGKGNGMKEGVKRTNADIIVFFDADIKGLKIEHIHPLVQPLLRKEAVMCVGLRERKWNLLEIIIKLDSLLAIGGERAVRRDIFESLPEKLIQGFAVESTLNYYCLMKKMPVRYVNLSGVDIIIKEKKWGFREGFIARLKEIHELIKIRILLRIWRGKLIMEECRIKIFTKKLI